jgi:glycosyltransferase involved in cell wall biosynthesis
MSQKQSDVTTFAPRQGPGPVKPRPDRLLLICYYDPKGISTVRETVAFMQSLSRFEVTVLNMFEHRHHEGYLAISPSVDLDSFAGIVIHNTVAYVPEALWSLDLATSRKLKDYTGVKVIMKQDENHALHKVVDYIGKTGFDLILTALPDEAVDLVYPPSIVGTPRFYRMLTGYVTPTVRALNPFSQDRPIDIGYRGSLQSLSFGRLAYEKRKIGDDIVRLLGNSGLTLDISSRWEDRFGGDAWYSFLASSKATLGAESGASLFDLAGDLDQRIASIEAEIGPERLDADYAEAYLARLADLEDNVHYHQISPRHFEAIACGTVQLLYPGTYSGILTVGRHYFSLERDYANLQDAVDLITDDARRQAMAKAAYEDIILNRDYWIETFVETFDMMIEDVGHKKGVLEQPVFKLEKPAVNILLLAAQEPQHDPRHRWTEAMALPGVTVHQLGIVAGSDKPTLKTGSQGGIDWSMPRRFWKNGSALAWYPHLGGSVTGAAALQELAFLELATALEGKEFRTLFSAPTSSPRIGAWWWHLRNILNVTATLIDTATRMRGIDGIIASDIYTLPAALILKGLFNIPVLYDAHEYAPELDLAAPEFEKQFWGDIEKRLVRHADFRQTVSPMLAKIMSNEYGVVFDTVVNCEPAAKAMEPREPTGADDCVFLFLGLFAAGRGINLLIEAWPKTNARAILHLQGPDNEYRQQMIRLAASKNLLGTRIFFPQAVSEEAMIATAHAADVGLVPYEPIGLNHEHCCPNKMSQYMAAGLAILANRTSFVAQTIKAANGGIVVNFNQADRLVAAIDELAANPGLRHDFARSGNAYFRSTFNWDVQSRTLKAHIDEIAQDRELRPLTVFAYPRLAGSFGPEEPLFPPCLDLDPGTPVAPPSLRSFAIKNCRRIWHRLPKPLKQALMPLAEAVKTVMGRS